MRKKPAEAATRRRASSRRSNHVRVTEPLGIPARATAPDLQHANQDLSSEVRGLRERQKQLERARAHYADLFDFAPVTYVLLDNVGLIGTINLTGCRLLGVERAQLIGRPFVSFVVHEDRRELLEHLRRCRTEKGIIETELRLQSRDGRRVTCRLFSQRPWASEQAVPTVIVDQTDRLALDGARLDAERRRDQAERDASAAQEASAGKDRFLATVSHELRTPLTPALFAASRLSSWTELPEQARKLAGTIKRNIEFEARLIDDLLDLARINRNRVNLRLETVDVHDIAREAIRICRPVGDSKNVTITAHFAAEAHHAKADPTRLRQVFWNLLINAVKFTGPGGSIVMVSTNPNDSTVRLSVRDNGAGMDAAVLQSLFSPFDRRTETDDSRTGLGLGLAISKGIVSAHGGQIWASSDGAGRGSTFAVELGTTPAPETRDSKGVPAVASFPSDSQRVLVVEDDGDSSEMLAQFLSQQGYRVEVVSSIQGALNRLTEHWDILLSDIGLPDGSGLEVARRARQMPNPPHRLIAFTGFGSTDDIRASREAGFDAHVVKPVDADSLLSALHPVADKKS